MIVETPNQYRTNAGPRKAVRTVAPTEVALTVDELKRHLGLSPEVSEDDTMLRDCIAAAAEAWEADTGMVLLTSTWAEKYDCWPEVVELDKRPIASVSSVTYLDAAGASTTLSSSYYTTDTARVTPSIFWKPTTTLPVLDPNTSVNLVTVTYVAGVAAAAVPTLIKQAMKLKAGAFYDERSDLPSKNVPLAETAYERIRAKFHGSNYP